jgi:hypothetical protein
MLGTLLQYALLLFSVTTYAMEVVYEQQRENVRLTKLNENIYTLFCDNRIPEAKKLLPKDKDMESFLICSLGQDNTNYFKWILRTKKPLFNSRGVQKTLEWVTRGGNHEYIIILNRYIEKERNKVELEWDRWASIEKLKIELLKAEQELANTRSSDQYTQCKELKIRLQQAQAQFDDLKSKNWELSTSDSSESQADNPDCRCIIS